MGAGKYRHYITIQQYTQTETDGVGQPVYEWSDFASVYAEIKPLRGQEYWSSQQVNAEVTHRISVRYIDGITGDMRIKFKDRYFSIEPPLNPDERNIELVMLCKENV